MRGPVRADELDLDQPGAVAIRNVAPGIPGHAERVDSVGRNLRHHQQAGLLSQHGPPDQAAIVELRARYDIEQLTSMIPDRRRAAG